MGQKVNPLGFRIGITEDWKSRWYATKQAYGEFLGEDYKLRKHIDKKLNRKPPFAAVSDILIERTREEVTITLKTGGAEGTVDFLVNGTDKYGGKQSSSVSLPLR